LVRLMRRSRLLPAERSPIAAGQRRHPRTRPLGRPVLPASQPGGGPVRAPGPRAPCGQSGSRARTAANAFSGRRGWRRGWHWRRILGWCRSWP